MGQRSVGSTAHRNRGLIRQLLHMPKPTWALTADSMDLSITVRPLYELPQHGPGTESCEHGAARKRRLRPMRPQWFRNIPGTQAFGRFDPEGSACLTAFNGTLTAADYSLQLASTVTRAENGAASFNPCTWDDANPPSPAPPPPPVAGPEGAAKPPSCVPSDS